VFPIVRPDDPPTVAVAWAMVAGRLAEGRRPDGLDNGSSGGGNGGWIVGHEVMTNPLDLHRNAGLAVSRRSIEPISGCTVGR
jgi:hypothetical protein